MGAADAVALAAGQNTMLMALVEISQQKVGIPVLGVDDNRFCGVAALGGGPQGDSPVPLGRLLGRQAVVDPNGRSGLQRRIRVPAHGHLAHSIVGLLLESYPGSCRWFHVIDQRQIVLAFFVVWKFLRHFNHVLVHFSDGFHQGCRSLAGPRVGKEPQSQVLVGDSRIAHERPLDKGSRRVFSAGHDNVVLVVVGIPQALQGGPGALVKVKRLEIVN
mmetsp:Transcript_19373/g.48242  ORF Transcript_19373/g.48242 Transcript_19373/m.48242 type:complete len:217 (-) Transcript_19373:222-872(-)